MRHKVATWVDAQHVAFIAGLAFLWPCLQSSGFYPLTLIPSIGATDPTVVAQYHLLYSCELLLAFIGIIAFGNRLENALHSSRVLPVVVGICGIAGQALFAFAAPDIVRFEPSAITIAGLTLIALFVASYVVLWGCRIADGDFTHAVLGVALSFLLSQIGLVPLTLAGLPLGASLCCCAAGTTLCAACSAQQPQVNGALRDGSLRRLPWRIVGTTVILIWFCIIYVRLLIPSYAGDASAANRLFAAVLCAGTYAVVVLYLAKNPHSDNRFIGVFILLIGAYMLGLLVISMFSDLNGPLSRRVLIASEHCLEAFLWMILCVAAIRERISPTALFGLYGIAVVTLPWVLSFDVRYLAHIPENFFANGFLASFATVALFAVALCTVTFLFQHMRQTVQELTKQVSSSRQEMVSSSLDGAGLTELELEVAKLVYRGYSAKRIAETLCVSEPSVKNCTSRVYRKLDIHSKQELISYIDEHGDIA